jgi:Ca2+-binding EF-hand superfamily protein
MFSFALAYILYRVVMRYNKDRYAHFMELANRRINSMRVESLGLSQAYNNYGPGKRQEQLKRIKPQLDLIAGRLRVVALAKNQDKLSSTGSNSNTDTTSTNHSTSSSSSKKNRESVRVQSEGAITFDAKRVFDELDADGNGNLSYTELNAILELNGVQLTEFVRRMNDLGCVSANCTVVSRRVFCRHFVNVLAETSNFGPTKEEAQQLFDEIAKQGTNKYGDVEPAKFYTSSLSTFSAIHKSMICWFDCGVASMIDPLASAWALQRNPHLLVMHLQVSEDSATGIGSSKERSLWRTILNSSTILQRILTQCLFFPLSGMVAV